MCYRQSDLILRKKFYEKLSSREEGLLDFRMDVKSLSELLKGTIDPTVRNEAEKKLAEVHKIIGFGPVLLQVLLYPAIMIIHKTKFTVALQQLITCRW